MEYADVIRDFVDRTEQNLRLIEEMSAFETRPDREAFEVTQLINSALGLLILPYEHYLEAIPEVPIASLLQDGWPLPTPLDNSPQPETLPDLLRRMRNAVAHFDVKFICDDGKICGLRLWNLDEEGRRKKTWHAQITVNELRRLLPLIVRFLRDSTTLP